MSSWAGPGAVGAVLTAALLHATLNAMIKGSGDRAGILARSSAVGAVVCGAGLVLVDVPAPAAWPWLIISVGLHVLYNHALLVAYRLGDFSQAYPLARGLSPLVVSVAAAIFVDERPTQVSAVGLLLIAASLATLGLTPWRRIRANGPAVVAAFLTGVVIAGYTLIDGIGVRSSGTAAGYALWLVGLLCAATAITMIVTRAGHGVRSIFRGTRRLWLSATLAVLMSALAYGLVLWAQTRGSLAAVAALRETSVVAAAVIGIVAFGEPMGRLRVAASVTVALGVIVLVVGG